MKKLTCLIAIALLAVGCRYNNANTKTKITIIGENAATIQSMVGMENIYETQNPTTDLVFKPSSYDDAVNKVNQDFANGTGLYDIVMQYNFSLSSFLNNDYVYKIDDLTKEIPDSLKQFEKDLFPNAWKEVGYYQDKSTNGMIKVGYPWASNSMLIMYNKSLFENQEQKSAYKIRYKKDLEIPKTYEEFVQVAEFFTQPQKQTHGVCLQGANGGWVYFEFMNFLYGMGGSTTEKQYGWQGDKDTKVTLNSPQALKALQLYKSLKPFNSGNWTNVEQSEQMKIMKEGKTAMAIVWSDLIYPTLSQDGSVGSKFGFAPVPSNKSILAGGAFFINKKSITPKNAAAYIIDIMQPKTQIELAKKGLCSPLKTVYDNPDVKKLPYTEAMKTSLERGGVVLEAGPDATMISEKITTYMQKYWNDELSAEQALSKMQTEIETERKKIFATLKK